MESARLASITWILIAVFLNAGAQIFLKLGMASSGKVSGADFISNIFVILLRPWILAGLGAYVVSVLVWMWVLAKSDVGFAYPFVSIGYIFAMVAAVFIFNEQFFWQRMVGVLVIFVGVLLITWTPSLTSN